MNFIQHLFKTPQLAVWVWWFLFLRGFNTPQKKGAGFIRNSLFSKKNMLCYLLSAIFVAFVLPNTAYAQQQAELYFATTNGVRIDATKPINLSQGENGLSLYLDTKDSSINGFKITISFSNAEDFKLVENTDAGKFNSLLRNKADTDKKTIFFSKFLTDTTKSPISGLLNLALITFTPSGTSGTIAVEKSLITSPGRDDPLPVALPQLTYTIQAPTPTPEPTKTTLLLTPIPTPTPESLEPTPTPNLTPRPKPKEVVSITIDGKSVDPKNPVIDLHLRGIVGQESISLIPIQVVITYSDRSTKEFDLVFQYKPPLTPTLIPPSPTPTPPPASIQDTTSCGKLTDPVACRARGCDWEVVADFGSFCQPASVPTPTPKSSILKRTKFYCAGSIDAYSCEFNAKGNTKGCCDKNGIARCISPNSTCDSPTLETTTWFCGGVPGGQPYEYAVCEDNLYNQGKTKECCYEGKPSCIGESDVCGATPTKTPTPTPTKTPSSSCYSYQTRSECKSNNCDWVFLPENSEYLCLNKGIR